LGENDFLYREVMIRFVNPTEDTIKVNRIYYPQKSLGFVFEIPPNDTITFTAEDYVSDEKERTDDPNLCCYSVFRAIFLEEDIQVNFGDSCKIFESGTGFTESNYTNSYEFSKAADYDFVFTYTFTQEELSKGEPCE
jgi:hypothetical protein